MYKHAEAKQLTEDHKIKLIEQLLELLPRIQPLIQQNQLQKDNIDAACQLLGMTLSEFDQCTQEEKNEVMLQIKRDAWLLFHPDKYSQQSAIQVRIVTLFQLINPAIEIVTDFMANPRKYTFATTEIAETYLVRPLRDMSLIQFPDVGIYLHKENQAEYWVRLIRLRKPVILRKDRSTLTHQYKHLFPDSDAALQNDSQMESILPENLFFELYRRGAIDFVHDCDAILKVLYCLPQEIAKKIVHSQRFLLVHKSRFNYFLKFVQLFAPIRNDQDVIFYALEHFPAHVRSCLLERYFASQYGHESQPHLVKREQYQKSCKKFIATLKERHLLRSVTGDGLEYLMKLDADLSQAIFNDLEWLLQLRESDKLYIEWLRWEQAVLGCLRVCDINDPNDQELLMAAMHPNPCELEVFDAKHIEKAYRIHQTRLPEWVGMRVQYALRLANRLTQPVELALMDTKSKQIHFTEAQYAALNRVCVPHTFKYNIRGDQRSIEIIQPHLQAWVRNFTQGKYIRDWINEFKVSLDQDFQRYFNREQIEYDFTTLQKLYQAIGYENVSHYPRQQFIKELMQNFDQQLLSDNHDPIANEATMNTILMQLERVDAASQFDSFSRVWRMTLRARTLTLLYPREGSNIDEFQVDEQYIYLVEMGVKMDGIYSYDDYAVMHDNYEQRIPQLTNLQSVFNVCRKLGGISEFINLTQRLLPGLAHSLHGEQITSWTTISEALDKLFVQRIRCVLNAEPLQLSFYCRNRNLFDSAELIMTAILATHPELANLAELEANQFIESFMQKNRRLENAYTSQLTL